MKYSDMFSEKFEEFVSSTHKSADNFKQYVELKKAIKETEDALAVSIYDLGSEVYEGKITGNTDEEAVAIVVAEITEGRKKLKSLKNQLNKLSGKAECPKCKAVTSCENDYCPKCGAKLFDVVIDGNDDKCDCECCCDDECAENEECCCCGCEETEEDKPDIEVEFTVSEDNADIENESDTEE